MGNFVHLNLKSNKNMDSLVSVKEAVGKAVEYGMDSLALTDNHTMHEVIDFIEECRKNKIKPIVGSEILVIEENSKQKYRFIFLAKNLKGYQNLVKLVSLAQLKEKPYISWDELKKYSGNIIGILNLYEGLSVELENDEDDKVMKVERMMELFESESFYIEMQNHGTPMQTRVNNNLIQLAESINAPIVATNDVNYLEAKLAGVREVRKAIEEGRVLENMIDSDQRYFKSSEEMTLAFEKYPKAIENTNKIANMCNLHLKMKGDKDFFIKDLPFQVPNSEKVIENLEKYFQPVKGYELPTNQVELKSISYLVRLSYKGLEDQYGYDDKVALNRLKRELGVVLSKKRVNLFLVTQDIVKYAEENNIPIGKGRGSVVGSLLAKTLGITDLCPIKYNLLFERFINPETDEHVADIDLDVSQEHRYRIIKYMVDKYGKNHVAQIVTFGKFGVSNSIKKICAAMAVEEDLKDKILSCIPNKVEELKSFLESSNPRAKKLVALGKENTTVKRVLLFANVIQHLPSSKGRSAAGVILSDTHIANHTPVSFHFNKALGHKVMVTQFPNNNDQLEKTGNMKLDILGSKEMDVQHKVKESIKKNYGLDKVEPDYEDKKTLELFAKGETESIFQLSSSGMREALRKVKPSSFSDVMVVSAMYRPGPMEMIGQYAKNKAEGNTTVFYSENKPMKEAKDIEHILKDTFGIIVYQEQIMQIAREWAGYSYGEADLLRRAVSKKKKDILDEHEMIFRDKAALLNRNPKTTSLIFKLIERFANYGFNKSHAGAYGQVSFEQGWFKANYPVEYMAVKLSSKMGDRISASTSFKEALRMGVTMFKPDVNNSMEEFVPTKNGILFGLPVIKHVGAHCAKSIVNERKNNGLFTSFDDFVNRSNNMEGVTKKITEVLVKAGAFDEFATRKQLLDKLNGKVKGKGGNSKYLGHFTLEEVLGGEQEITEDISDEEKMSYEMDLVGMSFTNPLAGKKQQIKKMIDAKNGKGDWIAGIITKVKKQRDKKENEMAFITVENGGKSINLTVFSSLWTNVQDSLKKGNVCILDIKKEGSDRGILQGVQKV